MRHPARPRWCSLNHPTTLILSLPVCEVGTTATAVSQGCLEQSDKITLRGTAGCLGDVTFHPSLWARRVWGWPPAHLLAQDLAGHEDPVLLVIPGGRGPKESQTDAVHVLRGDVAEELGRLQDPGSGAPLEKHLF